MLTAISVKDGAKTSIHLACSDDVKDITGKFFANCQVKKGSSKARNENITKNYGNFLKNL